MDRHCVAVERDDTDIGRTPLTGRFNAHFESLLFAMAEEVFWAGDRTAEGVIKALATANIMDYERKGLDPVSGRNYTRLMIASNNPWVVPAWSGGRRWFVLEVGDKHEKDFSYFAAIDEADEERRPRGDAVRLAALASGSDRQCPRCASHTVAHRAAQALRRSEAPVAP